MFDSNLKARWDYENSIAFAEEKAEKRGEHKKAIDIALKMKAKNVPFFEIAEFTGLSIEEIEKLGDSFINSLPPFAHQAR